MVVTTSSSGLDPTKAHRVSRVSSSLVPPSLQGGSPAPSPASSGSSLPQQPPLPVDPVVQAPLCPQFPRPRAPPAASSSLRDWDSKLAAWNDLALALGVVLPAAASAPDEPPPPSSHRIVDPAEPSAGQREPLQLLPLFPSIRAGLEAAATAVSNMRPKPPSKKESSPSLPLGRLLKPDRPFETRLLRPSDAPASRG